MPPIWPGPVPRHQLALVLLLADALGERLQAPPQLFDPAFTKARGRPPAAAVLLFPRSLLAGPLADLAGCDGHRLTQIGHITDCTSTPQMLHTCTLEMKCPRGNACAIHRWTRSSFSAWAASSSRRTSTDAEFSAAAAAQALLPPPTTAAALRAGVALAAVRWCTWRTASR